MENTLQVLSDADLDLVTGGTTLIFGSAGVLFASQKAVTVFSSKGASSNNLIENTGVSITYVSLGD